MYIVVGTTTGQLSLVSYKGNHTVSDYVLAEQSEAYNRDIRLRISASVYTKYICPSPPKGGNGMCSKCKTYSACVFLVMFPVTGFQNWKYVL